MCKVVYPLGSGRNSWREGTPLLGSGGPPSKPPTFPSTAWGNCPKTLLRHCALRRLTAPRSRCYRYYR